MDICECRITSATKKYTYDIVKSVHISCWIYARDKVVFTDGDVDIIELSLKSLISTHLPGPLQIKGKGNPSFFILDYDLSMEILVLWRD